jgi:hypothetical protein
MQTTTRPQQRQSIDELASEVLHDLYVALTGDAPRSRRAYRENDALMLILRFDPTILPGADGNELEPFAEACFMAILDIVAEVVSARSGREVTPGNLSVCAKSGLAVFAFSVLDDEPDARRGRPAVGRAALEKFDGGLRLAG